MVAGWASSVVSFTYFSIRKSNICLFIYSGISQQSFISGDHKKKLLIHFYISHFYGYENLTYSVNGEMTENKELPLFFVYESRFLPTLPTPYFSHIMYLNCARFLLKYNKVKLRRNLCNVCLYFCFYFTLVWVWFKLQKTTGNVCQTFIPRFPWWTIALLTLEVILCLVPFNVHNVRKCT